MTQKEFNALIVSMVICFIVAITVVFYNTNAEAETIHTENKTVCIETHQTLNRKQSEVICGIEVHLD